VCGAIGEFDAGSRDEVANGLRDDDFARSRYRCDARSDRDCEAGDLAVVDLALAHVDSDPGFEPDRSDAIDDRLCGADRPGWAVEGREEAIAGGVALLPSEAAELSAHNRVVFGEKVSPSPIADLCDTFC
jgi:hypothetical protein